MLHPYGLPADQTQKVFDKYEKWMVLDYLENPWQYNTEYSPCEFSDYWEEAGNISPVEHGGAYYWPEAGVTYVSEFRFDDGKVQTMGSGTEIDNGTHNVDPYSWPNSFDQAIYDWPKRGEIFENDKKGIGEPIYVGEYRWPMGSRESSEHSLFYYYHGRFHSSDEVRGKFRGYGVVISGNWRKRIDAFDSEAKYGGFWDGQARVGELKTKRVIQIEEE